MLRIVLTVWAFHRLFGPFVAILGLSLLVWVVWWPVNAFRGLDYIFFMIYYGPSGSVVLYDRTML